MKDKLKTLELRIRDTYQNVMFVKSIVVGCIGAFVDLSLLFVFTDILYWNYWISANVAFAITILVNFSLQKFWTFRDSDSIRTSPQVLKFFTLSLLNLFVNSILVYVFVSLLGVWYLLSQATATIILFFFNFAIYRFYIFTQK